MCCNAESKERVSGQKDLWAWGWIPSASACARQGWDLATVNWTFGAKEETVPSPLKGLRTRYKLAYEDTDHPVALNPFS